MDHNMDFKQGIHALHTKKYALQKPCKRKIRHEKVEQIKHPGDKIWARCWAKHDTGSIEYWKNRSSS
jgi:hypothetical protein